MQNEICPDTTHTFCCCTTTKLCLKPVCISELGTATVEMKLPG